MTERQATVLHVNRAPQPRRIDEVDKGRPYAIGGQGDADKLPDTIYLAWVIVEACKLIIKLVDRRWVGVGKLPTTIHRPNNGR